MPLAALLMLNMIRPCWNSRRRRRPNAFAPWASAPEGTSLVDSLTCIYQKEQVLLLYIIRIFISTEACRSLLCRTATLGRYVVVHCFFFFFSQTLYPSRHQCISGRRCSPPRAFASLLVLQSFTIFALISISVSVWRQRRFSGQYKIFFLGVYIYL